MKDKRLASMMDPKAMPFDMKRMIYGGFKVLVDAKWTLGKSCCAWRSTMSALDKSFTARLQRSPGKAGWTFVVMPGSGEFFGTRGLVKVAGTVDGHPFGSFHSWPLVTVHTNCRSGPSSARCLARTEATSWKSA